MGKTVVLLICLFLHVCTELSMLSTNFLDSTRIYSMLKLQMICLIDIYLMYHT